MQHKYKNTDTGKIKLNKTNNTLRLVCFTASILATVTFADSVVIDDQVVLGSECIGATCENGEVFDFDTLKLKADKPAIHFHDTSSSASFPSNDWRMGMSGDAQTSNSVFYIEDADSQTRVLQLSSTPEGGVAIGADAELAEGAVSVGAAGKEKRITHVAQGILDSDAVNFGQFKQFETSAQANNQSSIDALNNELSSLQSRMDNLSGRLESIATRLESLN